MIDRIASLPAEIDGFRARGLLSREDYQKTVLPFLEQARAEGRQIRLLYHFGPEFEGFTAGGAWEDARLGLQYIRLCERCAVVTDIGWIQGSSRFLSSLLPCPVRSFGNSDFHNAVEWLTEPSKPRGLSYRLLQESGVLILEPQGPLRVEDFDHLALQVDPWIESHGKLRGIVLSTKSFPGWESMGSLFRHIRFVRNHHQQVRRIAIAGDGALMQLSPMLAEHFVHADVKHFPYEGFPDALAWATSESV